MVVVVDNIAGHEKCFLRWHTSYYTTTVSLHSGLPKIFFLTHEEEGLKIVQHEQEAIEHSFLHAARDI